MKTQKSPLQEVRLRYQPQVPQLFNDLKSLVTREDAAPEALASRETLEPILPNTLSTGLVHIESGERGEQRALRVGVVLSGGQAAGGHNVIWGIHEALTALHPESALFGFLNGPSGIVNGEAVELTADKLADYRNQGGFDLIGSGRTKIETDEQFARSLQTVKQLNLDGLVVIGGDDSNTNAALLAEYFRAHGQDTAVVGVPKTIDGDLRNEWIEMSFGCDTACKTYSETIASIMRDALSAKKYYYFVKLMGRSASHITLECALQTHPNVALIGEEVAAKGQTLDEVTKQICDVICRRADDGKNFGVVLVPEGIIEFMPDVKTLIGELNRLLVDVSEPSDAIAKLSPDARRVWQSLPQRIQEQLLIDRDPHGNVQVSKIETERLLIQMVERELAARHETGLYEGKFAAQPHFCGYEGRSCLPSNFDAQYCYSLGLTAALLVAGSHTGVVACVRHLGRPATEWVPCGVPLWTMIHLEERHGKQKPVIQKALVDLDGRPFAQLQEHREAWALGELYRYPGPIQFAGDAEVTDAPMLTVQLESASSLV